MARTPDARDTGSTTLVESEDTALSLDPSSAPLLRKAPSDFDEQPKTPAQRTLVGVFVFLPMLALVAAIPFAWGWGLNWHDIVIGAVFYWVSGFGITIGFHRYFTHSSFKAKPGLRVGLAIAGSLAMEGPVINWVADHRRHHKYSDKEGDPHSPWRYGEDAKALVKGLLWAHVLWLFDENRTSRKKYAPDLLADRKIHAVSAWFPAIVAFTLLAPALIGGFWTSGGVWSWHAAIEAFFWASVVRVTLLHHVTWSTNSICHTWGNTDWQSRDRSVNVAWLAIASFGESWHNLHHADPTCARHGALKGQIDQSARVIKWFENLGWAYDVRWPDETRLNAKRAADSTRSLGGMTKRNEKATTPLNQSDKAAA
ncbi:MAG TPA: fatty acid desaturase [Trebonia sp.]|jgi:stearoyl-CoA desaturase (delta-9 desaturase)